MTRPLLVTTLLATVVMGCDRGSPQPEEAGADPAASAPCRPVDERRPNAPEQRPAFEGQTRACAVTSNVSFDVVVMTRDLTHPWAVEPLPDGRLLLSERPGRLRLISADGEAGPPIEGVPEVDARGQGGLLDVALSPSFASDRTIFWSYSERRDGGNATSVARGVLDGDGRRLEQVQVIFRAQPAYGGERHFGSRLTFDDEGMLLATLGDRFDAGIRRRVQELDNHLGKIVRITPEGKPAPDNPFIDRDGALPEIWTLGHRNVQAAAFDAEGRFWVVEHGAQGGDELNLIEKGQNFGWPLVTYGEDYSGEPIPGAVTAREGYVQPVYYWDPVIAPSGAQFYTGTVFEGWRGSLFVGALREERLVRLVIEHERVVGEEHLLADRGQRIRDVRQGPDGLLYIVTDEANGELWKLTPK